MAINVLVFPAGEINSVELHDALCSCVNVKVWGASSIERHGSYVFANYIPDVPLITDVIFIDYLNNLIIEKQIDCIFPTHDTVAKFLAYNRNKIKAKIVAADYETSRICRNKLETYQLFSNFSFAPKIFEKIISYPVFIKPREGQGSVGAKIINSKEDVPNVDLEQYVICEYLPGEEYTVDCFTDKNGELVSILPRSRKRVMAGVSVAGQNEKLTPDIVEIAKVLNNRLSFLGLWWFQIKRDVSGNWKLLEISTRCAGTMALSRALGVNLPLLSVYATMGFDVSIELNKYNVQMDSTLIRRYKIDYNYDTVYIDFDDTITLNNKVNLKAIWFLYQCQNQHKKVILLTKHAKEIDVTLSSYHIDKGLFNKIVSIKEEEDKFSFITLQNAIFIDNSFKERKSVFQNLNIPVFDVDGLDVLMDWRV